MLTKNQKGTLIKVCKVLFPKYKHVNIDRVRKVVVFSNCKLPFLSWFFPKWKLSLNELLNCEIPSQLSDFKYGSKDFRNLIHEDIIKCELTNEDVINYFYGEIAQVKYADLYKQLNVVPSDVHLTTVVTAEDELFEDLIQMYEEKNYNASKPSFVRRLLWFEPNYEVLFYFALFLLIAYAVLTQIKV